MKDNLQKIKDMLLNDAAFVHEMKENRGVDLIEKKATKIAINGGLDEFFFV